MVVPVHHRPSGNSIGVGVLGRRHDDAALVDLACLLARDASPLVQPTDPVAQEPG
jgi:Asp-tRNA(Asn)/Glu-tRNA(Gln) amidotransferase A subunit family amidase